MQLTRLISFTVLVLAMAATPAWADATAFIGSTMTPTNRAAKGIAVGVGLLIVGFEFEYATTGEDAASLAPALRTGMGNVLLQTPFPIAGMQFYGTIGGGGYQEELGGRTETQVGVNSGGGVKVSLLGPLRARVDYRVFKLRGEPQHAVVHRVYAGINLAF